MSQAQRRALSLLDFLEAYYRRRFPAVRDVSKFDDFLVRDEDLPSSPGIAFTPGGRAWLKLKLVAPPAPPTLPTDLTEYVEDVDVSGHVPPSLNSEIDDEEQEIAAAILEQWIAETWQPWSERWSEIERGRSFYKKAFDLRARLGRDRDAFELVWGFGRLRWSPGSEGVDHPLLTVPIEIEHDNSDGSLSFVPAGPVFVEYAFLTELPLADRASYVDRRRSAEDIELDPWNAESIADEFEGLLRAIDLDGTMEPQARGRQDGHATLTSTWVLYLRRRQADYLGFLEAQRDVVREDPDALPLPLASLVVDEPSQLTGTGSWGDTEAVELLLPLPANEEQHAILTKAAQRAGVTAQGPPGTGKSHTIANLISHFVAHGQRVLVVAEKEQALSVVADKVPAGIRALVVSNLGSDAEARTRLEQSIRSIQSGVFSPTTVPAPEELTRRQQTVAQLSSQVALLSSELRDRRMAEGIECPQSITAPGRSKPSEVATWLAEHATTLGFIPDRLTAGTPCPVTPEELADLANALREFDAADLEEACLPLPPLDLAGSAQLAEAATERDQLTSRLSAAPVADWTAIDASDAQFLNDLANQVEEIAAWFTKWSGTWLSRVLTELADPGYYQSWTEFASTLRRDRERALTHARALMAHVVSIPDAVPEPIRFRDALVQARDRFSAGKSLGVLRYRDARDAAESCKVDGVTPATGPAIQLCLYELELREARRRLAASWANQTVRVGASPLEGASPEHEIGDPLSGLEWLLQLSTKWPALVSSLSQLDIGVPPIPDEDDIDRVHETCQLFAVRRRHQALVSSANQLDDYLAGNEAGGDAAPLWHDLRAATKENDWSRWDRGLERSRWLHSISIRAHRVATTLDRIAQVAPLWAGAITDTRGASAGDPGQVADAWRWRCAETWITDLNNRRSVAELQRAIEETNAQRLNAVEQLVVGRAWSHLSENFGEHHREALQKYVAASKRLGKGHSIYAARYQRQIRDALTEAKDAVPVWIMTIRNALESFRPSAEPPFDVLIVDEASQVGLDAIPVLGLARRAIIVGDDKQTSPENVGLNRQGIFDLIDEHLHEIPNHGTLFDPDSSLYDLAAIKFPDIVMLREHFRCLPEIIAFSSNRYYNGKIQALRDKRPAPGWFPTGTVHVKIGYRQPGLDINENEALAVVDLIAELIERPEYDGMTFGVISMLGTKQALRIQELLLDHLGSAIVEERRIRCGDASNFQGDERDVVLISLVVGPDESGQLGKVGAFTGGPAERRVNVAASRARNQMWLVHSIEPEDFPARDPRAELVRHCRAPSQLHETADGLLKKCESDFERRVLLDILARGYRHVRVQKIVGNYRIDMVVEGPEGHLAVECDGNAWHGDDRWDQDRARQTVLERAGWTFERIAGSAYYRDPTRALEPLWKRLDELQIPTGEWAEDGASPPPRRVVDQVPALEGEFGIDAAEVSFDDPVFDEDLEANATVDQGEAWSAPESQPFSELESERQGPQVNPRASLLSVASPAPEAPPVAPSSLFSVPSPSPEAPPVAPSSLSSVPSPSPEAPPVAPSSLSSVPSPSPDAPHVSRPQNGSPLAPYITWHARPLPVATEADSSTLSEALAEIVRVEGPILARRAYLLCHQAAGGHRVGKDIRSAFNRACHAVITAGLVHQISDGVPGQIDKTLYTPGTPPVVVRELGPRDLYDVPPSEVRSLLEQQGADGIADLDACRAVLDAYGLHKLTQKASAFIQECRSYSWEPS